MTVAEIEYKMQYKLARERKWRTITVKMEGNFLKWATVRDAVIALYLPRSVKWHEILLRECPRDKEMTHAQPFH